ncbi:RNA polymerase sigma factor [Membranihabitans marinus]|uniref:RNA polymerase sigma factor n=1 Tax=Membranihabitans marinus TaxID=1227546 RepID=UPI001F1ECFE0|nr:hypothetical protein [Membranihabitans marinus]
MNGKIHIDDPRNTLSVIAEGEGGTCTTIYNWYMVFLLKFALRFGYHHKEDSHKVLQKVFYKIWTYSSQITGITCLETYVYRMTQNLLYDGFKTLKFRQHMFIGFPYREWEIKSVCDVEVNRKCVKSTHKLKDEWSPNRMNIFKMRTQKEMVVYKMVGMHNVSRLGVMKESDESIKENKNRLSYDHGLSSGWFIFYFINSGYFKFQ